MKTHNIYNNKQNAPAAAGSAIDLYIYEEIDSNCGIGKKQIADALAAAEAIPINLHISSLGGNVDDALAIYDLLKSYPGKITAKLSGIVASSATIIALGADVIEMSENALFMIHNPWSFAVGDANEMRKTAELSDKFKTRLVSIYVQKTGLAFSDISDMMDTETWLDAEEALEYGFVDCISAMAPAKKIKNSALKKKGFKNIPAEKIQNFIYQPKLFFNMQFKKFLNEIRKEISQSSEKGDHKGSPLHNALICENTNKGGNMDAEALATFENRLNEADAKIRNLQLALQEKDRELAQFGVLVGDSPRRTNKGNKDSKDAKDINGENNFSGKYSIEIENEIGRRMGVSASALQQAKGDTQGPGYKDRKMLVEDMFANVLDLNELPMYRNLING